MPPYNNTNSNMMMENPEPPTQQPQREQKAPLDSHILYCGKLIVFYADHLGKNQVVGIPRQKVMHLTEMYPLDLHFMFQEVRTLMETHRVRRYTTRIFDKDWAYSPHLHLQITLPRFLLENMARTVGIPLVPAQPKNQQGSGGPSESTPLLEPAPAQVDTVGAPLL